MSDSAIQEAPIVPEVNEVIEVPEVVTTDPRKLFVSNLDITVAISPTRLLIAKPKAIFTKYSQNLDRCYPSQSSEMTDKSDCLLLYCSKTLRTLRELSMSK
jgi:hypothetical protein